MTTTIKEQRLDFLAKFACAVGMAGGYAEGLLQHMDTDKDARRTIFRGLRLPATRDFTGHLGSCYPLLIAATVPGLGKEVSDAARMTFGRFVNEVGDLYEAYKTAKHHEVFASIEIRGKITCKCRAVVEEVTKLVNGQLDADVSDADRLFFYCYGKLVTQDEVSFHLGPSDLRPELSGIKYTNEMLEAVFTRLEQHGYKAEGYASSDHCEEGPPNIRAWWPYECEEGHPYGIRKVYLNRTPVAA